MDKTPLAQSPSRSVAMHARRWPWVGLAAVASLAFTLPALAKRRRGRPYTGQEELMTAYVRGRLGRKRR